ncbi:MAG: UDP-3-O-(3-hydroxymyristoyl)glucosamine N-acyltransferase [Pseudomonadota bacterium]
MNTSIGLAPLHPDPRFFSTAPPIDVVAAAALAGATIHHSDSAQKSVTHVAPLSRAGEGAVVFADTKKALNDDIHGLPALVFTTEALAPLAADVFPDATVGFTPYPKAAFASVARALHQSLLPDLAALGAGISSEATVAASATISPTAIVLPGAELAEDVLVGPFSLIGPGVILGSGTHIGSHCAVSHATLGTQCRIHSGVRIGEPGFGYVSDGTAAQSVPQLGRVLMADYVDIGANSTVDRGALEDTIIGTGTKIDNQVQVGHNCRIGRGVLVAAQTGVSGSCVIGDGVMIGGQAGMADHLTIGDGAIISAKSGLMKDVPPGERWGGVPAKPAREWMKDVAALSKLTKKGKVG